MGTVKTVLREARAMGFAIERTRGSHFKLTAPSGALVFAASTPSDRRAIHNIRADLRRALRQGREL
jgi:predicted RNA binding protein YcfA (HicA-like mRNA interferase family)